MQKTIENEYSRLVSSSPPLSDIEFVIRFETFCRGAWSSFREYNQLLISENVAYNKQLTADPDHW